MRVAVEVVWDPSLGVGQSFKAPGGIAMLKSRVSSSWLRGRDVWTLVLRDVKASG